MGLVSVEFPLLSDRNLFDNIALPLEAAGRNREFIRSGVNRILRLSGLELRMTAFNRELSNEERRIALIARAAAGDPAVILADDPTAGLDGEASIRVLKLLKTFNDRGMAVVVTGHDQTLCHAVPGVRTVLLAGGKFRECSNVLPAPSPIKGIGLHASA